LKQYRKQKKGFIYPTSIQQTIKKLKKHITHKFSIAKLNKNQKIPEKEIIALTDILTWDYSKFPIEIKDKIFELIEKAA